MACQVKLVVPVQHNKWHLKGPNGLTSFHVFINSDAPKKQVVGRFYMRDH